MSPSLRYYEEIHEHLLPCARESPARTLLADLRNCRGVRLCGDHHYNDIFPPRSDLFTRLFSHVICSLRPLGSSGGRQKSHRRKKMQNRKSLTQLRVLNLKKALKESGQKEKDQ